MSKPSRLIFGAGYLGSRVVREWQKRGDDVTIVTRSVSSAKRWQALGATPLVASVTDAASLEEQFAGLDARFETVLYAVGYDRSSDDDRDELAIYGLRNAISAVGTRAAHWIYASSTSVYGQLDGSWVDEDSPAEPAADNGRRSLRAEQVLSSGVPFPHAIVRFAGLYGPNRTLARRETFESETPLPGSGDQWLNLIHVEDATRLCIVLGDCGSGGVWLACDDQPVQRADYYKCAADLLQTPPPRFDEQPRQRRGAANKRCRNDKMKQLLPQLKFPTYRTGLADAVGQDDESASIR